MKLSIFFVLVFAAGVFSILLGEDADRLDYKFQALIHVPYFEGSTEHVTCGGSVIHSRWILTAAHCFDFVYTNGTNFFLGLTEENVYSYRNNATEVIVHPGYSAFSATAYDDISLVKVPPVTYNQYIQPVQLSNTTLLDNQLIIMAGWGLINTTSYPNELQYLMLRVINNTECQRVFQNISANQFCTRSELQVACIGDSGGPAMLNDGQNRKQVGLVSFGSTNCEPNSTTAYTKTASYIPWMKTVTRINRL